ncbi:unnamed protein product [Calicophoron daubneyi]|uniref:Globin domain-containing protein n=1 Tax=Calicophoron daubneyi TaxID=300641 RepID=A0AAV2THZ3_CALDB
MALTKNEQENFLKEWTPYADTKEHIVSTGLGAYNKLFHAHPEYIQYFSRLEGLTIDNVMQSEGVKHYAETLVRAITQMAKVATDEKELKKYMAQYGKDHAEKELSRAEFMTGEPIFTQYFQSLLKEEQNKKTLAKLLRHVFPPMCAEI